MTSPLRIAARQRRSGWILSAKDAKQLGVVMELGHRFESEMLDIHRATYEVVELFDGHGCRVEKVRSA